MKANELIKELQTLVETYGDQEILSKNLSNILVNFTPVSRNSNETLYVTDELNLDRDDVICHKNTGELRKVLYRCSRNDGNIYKTIDMNCEDEMICRMHPVSSELWDIVSRHTPEKPRVDPKEVNAFLIEEFLDLGITLDKL